MVSLPPFKKIFPIDKNYYSDILKNIEMGKCENKIQNLNGYVYNYNGFYFFRVQMLLGLL